MTGRATFDRKPVPVMFLARSDKNTPASCATHPELPWVSDDSPNWKCRSQMREICAGCPVRRPCAAYAVSERPAGFYAGVWVASSGGGRTHALLTLANESISHDLCK